MNGRESHPSAHTRSMTEKTFLKAMDVYINDGRENEKYLAQFCKDLVQLTGDQPKVRDYLNRRALQALNGGDD